jgi:ribosome assembly protein 4
MSALAFAMDSSSEEEGDMELEGGGGEGSTVLSSMSKVDQEAMAKADAAKELTERDIANEKRRALFSANPRKRLRKLEAAVEAQKLAKKKNTSIVIQLETMTGEKTGPEIQVDTSTTMRQLEALLKEVLGSTEKQPYAFYNNEMEIMTDLYDFIEANKLSTESLMQVKYQPLSVFRVNPVTRCSHSMPGHMDSILHVSFSPQGDVLASGGGDTTVRFWDIYTATPVHVCRGHKHHVLCTAWSPDGKYFTSGDFKGEVRLWDPKKGEQRGKTIKAHKQWITGIVWQPHHLNAKCELFATSSKDKLARVWNARSGRMVTSMSGHSDSIESIRWGGSGLIYTGSRDRSIKAWRLDSQNRAILVRTLTGHAHRVNTIALNSDYVCRSGAFSHATRDPDETPEQLFKAAQERYATAKKTLGKEILVSGSDDFTMFLWEPETSKKPITRLTGHQQLINHINFSPDGRYFASASFDKKVKVWDGRTGKFIATLNGHVAFVYQVVWSADSRLLCSASKDSTVKVWTMSNLKKAKETLSGHFDEVYALDWSPNGERLASGSKDRMIKIWQN